MKKRRFSLERIHGVLKQAEAGMPVAETKTGRELTIRVYRLSGLFDQSKTNIAIGAENLDPLALALH